MKQLFIAIISGLSATSLSFGQCELNASATPSQIYCGQSSVLSAFGIGAGTVVMSEDFNSGFGPGWSGTPGATSFSNPCSPNGADGTPHAWMDNNTSVPRTLTSSPYDISTATAGVTICFDLLFAVQGGNAPCEGPDEPDEGVYFQYSTDGGATWVTIHYFDPNGGNDSQLTNWNNWCFQIPQAAITPNTMFRWHQTADSGAAYDHWGIDNVQIVQNDVNAEVVWGNSGDDYYHSYGVGSSGGVNPNAVSPTQTTTYTVTITTGTGEVCTTDVTVVVLDPVYEVNIDVTPSPICAGDCADITGTAVQVIDPGGIERYENNQVENVSGAGIGTVGASVNVNVQGINVNALTSGMITEVCINQFNYFAFGFPTSVTVADFEFKLVAPGGCGEIILIPQGTLQPSTQAGGMQNVCFVMGGATNIGSVSQPYSGTYEPSEPFDNLVGCDPNGVWSIEISAPAGFNIGIGAFSGWSITFDDPPIHAPVTASWSPATGLSDANILTPEACPSSTTNYDLTISNGVQGCATHTEPVTIVVDQCNGCDNPDILLDPLTACAPNGVDLPDAINPASDPATISFHANQADAQADVNPLSNTSVSTSGTYWIRAENPAADTCFITLPITVTIASQDDASFTLTDFCENAGNAAGNIATTGGSFAFNPTPSDGASIDATTGEISNGVPGTAYSVEYTTNGSCPSSSTETVSVNPNPTPSITGNFTYCPGGTAQLNAGSGYTSYSWTNAAGTEIGTSQTFSTTAITDLRVTVTDANGCTGVSATVSVSESNVSEYPVTVTMCPGESITVHGIAVSSPGVYIDTFAVAGGCDSVSIVTVNESVITVPVITGQLWYCSGETASLSTTPQNYTSYSWSTGSTQSGINTTTNQPITVTVTNADGCTATSAPVVLTHPPLAGLNANPSTGTAPLIVDFTNTSTGANSYDWYFPSIDTFSTVTMDGHTHTYDQTGVYNVTLVAHSEHCSDTAVVTITVITPDQPLDIEIPNVFTPNGDGVNDFFTFNSNNVSTLEVVIVNRWGNLMYKTDDINFHWNGKDMNGRLVTEGVYFYTYKAIGVMGDERSGHGFVTVEY